MPVLALDPARVRRQPPASTAYARIGRDRWPDAQLPADLAPQNAPHCPSKCSPSRLSCRMIARDRANIRVLVRSISRTRHPTDRQLGVISRETVARPRATNADIEALVIERGHRTLVITCKGGKVVTIPLARPAHCPGDRPGHRRTTRRAHLPDPAVGWTDMPLGESPAAWPAAPRSQKPVGSPPSGMRHQRRTARRAAPAGARQ